MKGAHITKKKRNNINLKVEVPKITQQVQNTHVQRVANTVEVEEPNIFEKTPQLKIQAQEKVEVPKITQQVQNTHAQHVVEVEEPKIIEKTAQLKIQTQEKVEVPKTMQQVENSHVQHDANAVEVEKTKFIMMIRSMVIAVMLAALIGQGRGPRDPPWPSISAARKPRRYACRPFPRDL